MNNLRLDGNAAGGLLTFIGYESPASANAPELSPGDWINSEPLTLKDLRGRVVLIDFGTFGCYNCRNTLPFIKAGTIAITTKT